MESSFEVSDLSFSRYQHAGCLLQVYGRRDESSPLMQDTGEKTGAVVWTRTTTGPWRDFFVD